MPIIERVAPSLQSLVNNVLEIAGTLDQGRFLWFRGISCSTHSLKPKICRDGKPEDEVFDRETRLLTRFRQRSMAYWTSGYPQTDWEHLFAMQHFGMPTRLLDWSENLFVSCHFALNESPSHSHDGSCIPVIWCVDPIAWNRSTAALSGYGDAIHVLTTAAEELEAYQPRTTRKRLKSPIAMYGSHNSDRIVAQRGTFMVWGKDVRSLEEIVEEQSVNMWKIILTGEREDMSESLRHLGFSETMVFPELTSLSTELNRMEGWR